MDGCCSLPLVIDPDGSLMAGGGRGRGEEGVGVGDGEVVNDEWVKEKGETGEWEMRNRYNDDNRKWRMRIVNGK